MLKIAPIINGIISSDYEAYNSLSRGILNLSSYARMIHKDVEKISKKQVKITSIIMSLSRLKSKLKSRPSIIKNVDIGEITVKTPLVEIVFNKNIETLKKLELITKKIKPKSNEWLHISQNSKSVIIICSEEKTDLIIDHMQAKPELILKKLSALGLYINKKYHTQENITFSLLYPIAKSSIPLDEIFTTRDEMVFIFQTKYLSRVMDLFRISETK